MKVALVSLHFAEYAGRLALALERRHEVVLVLNAANAAYELTTRMRDELASGGEVRWLRQPRRLLAPAQVFELVSTYHRFKPDVVHIQETNNCVAPWANDIVRYRYPTVLTVHDPIPHSGDDPGVERSRPCRHRLRRRADRIIVHGESLRREWIAREPGIESRLRSVAHGYLSEPQADGAAGSETPGTFLFFGRMEAYKGLAEFLAAGDLLAERGYPIRLLVAGRGPELDRLGAAFATRPWAEIRDEMIPAEDIPSLFRRAAAVVLPYTDATQSGVAAIAAAAGRPVIATRVGGLPDVVVDGCNGLLIPPGDTAALAAAMARLIDDEDLQRRLSTGAARLPKDRMNWDLIAEQTAGVYAEAVAGCSSGRDAA